ncbi:protein of unknown function [Algoriphagus locisalis]|uniref:DUF4625 domain-containing protein n=1 Tax=Algoriphagus locisalis TaxID=305507 RepID=A0A1I6XFH6_9BACT|nr:DUF4625 domain-containing protein [Algoriphagus locisalis]SFT36782.1 protein of unknown function [Algoriphagus locisalis]
MKNYIIVLLAVSVLTACGEDEKPAIDLEYPEIIATANSFPIQCSVVERGETMQFRASFSDNVELGSYSLDIHHNFDHHTHSTEVNDCESDPVKAAVNPMLFIQTYTIPTGLTEYEAEAEIDIPSGIDPGDYHFLIRVTDKEGWQTLQGISIKIL